MTYIIVNKDNKPLNTFTPDVPVYRNPFLFSDKTFTVYNDRKSALDAFTTIKKTINTREDFSDRTYKVAAKLSIKERTE